MTARPLCPLKGSSGTGGQKFVDQRQGRDFTTEPWGEQLVMCCLVTKTQKRQFGIYVVKITTDACLCRGIPICTSAVLK